MKPMILFAAALVLTPAVVMADGQPAAGETIAPANCQRPPFLSKVRAADDDSDFTEKAEAYKTCIDDYVSRQNDLAQKHAAAANAAIADYNQFANEANARKRDQQR